jgi:hypothetical protein
MKLRLEIHNGGRPLYRGIHDVYDADSFARACAAAWTTISERQAAEATSVGALFEALEDKILEDLNGAELRFSRV